jgi:acetolactate decarboxylase
MKAWAARREPGKIPLHLRGGGSAKPGHFSAAMALALLASAALAAARPGATVEVETFGSLREIIREGRLEARAPIAAALARPHAYGLGARARLDGEFLILDGTVHESRPDGRGRVRTVAFDASRDSAALMVAAHVAAWRDIGVATAISMTALEDTLAARARAFGLPASGPVPFLILGPVTGLRWHVADGRLLAPGPSSHEAHAKAAVRGARDAISVTVVGFYSDHHQGVFTHHDSRIHMHVLLADGGGAAHVDSLRVAAGAVLRLPLAR